jgi:hypothetical protein
MDRLLSAYQENLVSLEQLRSRMPELPVFVKIVDASEFMGQADLW